MGAVFATTSAKDSLELIHASFAIKSTLDQCALTNTAKSVLNGKGGWFLRKEAVEITSPLRHQSINVISVQKHLVGVQIYVDINAEKTTTLE